MKKTIIVCLVAAFAMTGCIMPNYKSLNAQRSAIRGTGDISVSLSLDSIENPATAESVAVDTKNITIAVDKFLQDGKVADLTIPEITGELRKIIPADYQFIYDLLIAQISTITVPTDVIGANNVKRMRALCAGIIVGCSEYDVADRPVPPNVATRTLVSKPEVIEQFGKQLKIESAKKRRVR
jgi:hypothetical protein